MNKKKIWVLNGPNLNFLGIREPDIYGKKCYGDYIREIKEFGKKNNIKVTEYQTNSEGELVDFIQYAYVKKVNGIVINPGAYTHYSYAIRDAIKAVGIDTIEVHISNINEREEFRKVSVIRDVVKTTFMGEDCYLKALEYFIK